MKKLISKILVIMALAVMAMPLTSNAGFQANKGGKSYTTSDTIFANDLFIGIRNMEKEGGTLGLTAKIQTSSYLEEGDGNGLDCHMAKNTEWGTAAMLATSIYGEVPAEASKSISGNDSGIFQMADSSCELVSGFFSSATSNMMSTIKNADPRYYDSYTDSKTSKPGDAMNETAVWKGANGWSFQYSDGDPMFCRNYSSKLFGFFNHDGAIHGYNGGGITIYTSARAVVVCGAGL